MALETKVLDEVLAGCKTPEDVDKLYSQMLQRLINRSLEAEMDAHLGYEKNDKAEGGRRGNTRNGKATKTVKGTFGELQIETPRDRDGSFGVFQDSFRIDRVFRPPFSTAIQLGRCLTPLIEQPVTQIAGHRQLEAGSGCAGVDRAEYAAGVALIAAGDRHEQIRREHHGVHLQVARIGYPTK